MQGLSDFIPTETKISYLNSLLEVGFDTLDFGSFVSPKAIPQLRDTTEVLAGLDLESTNTKLLAIVANLRGAEAACEFSQIEYLGFPLSVSETFQQRNTNKSISEALEVVKVIQALCKQHNKKQVVYLSMGFGNPYGDPYSPKTLSEFVEKLAVLGVEIVSLADTIGVSNPEVIQNAFQPLLNTYSGIEFGAHLHSNPASVREKVAAIVDSGVYRIDTAMNGFGGCPMAKDELVGNLATELVLEEILDKKIDLSFDKQAFSRALLAANKVFETFH